MITAAVHHISYAVSDLERSQRFYGETLGLDPIERPDLGLPGAWYSVGNAEVHLILTPAGADVGTRPASLTPLANHNAFAVSDYQETVEHFKNAKIEVLETSPDRGQLWIRDPDGNVLEFISAR